MKQMEIRSQVDDRTERMNLKIREAQLAKVPYMLIIGDKEVADSKISVRLRNGQDLGMMELSQFRDRLTGLVNSRATVEL